MKLDRLIEDLLAIQEELKDNDVDTSEVDVLAGIQPSYPLTGVALGVIHGQTLADDQQIELGEEERKAVWIATDQVSSYSKYNPYAPRALWEAVN
jgi:hypothetical protein